MRLRLNVILPEETVRLLDRAAARGNRSRLIDQAVRRYLRGRNLARLRKLLREGALQRAARDLGLAEEWFSLDEETWQSGGR